MPNRDHVPGSNFDCGGALTDPALLGDIDFRYPPFREGWTLVMNEDRPGKGRAGPSVS